MTRLLEEKWNEEVKKRPAYMTDHMIPWSKVVFEEQNYYACMETLCSGGVEAFRFTPAVEPKSEAEVMLVQAVDVKIAKELETELKAKLEREKEAAPAFVRTTLPQDPTANFLAAHYHGFSSVAVPSGPGDI